MSFKINQMYALRDGKRGELWEYDGPTAGVAYFMNASDYWRTGAAFSGIPVYFLVTGQAIDVRTGWLQPEHDIVGEV